MSSGVFLWKGKKMKLLMQEFLREETGAVTIPWLVVVAAMGMVTLLIFEFLDDSTVAVANEDCTLLAKVGRDNHDRECQYELAD